MFDFFERGFLATVGVLSLSREKVQEVVDKMVARGDLNLDEGKQLVDKLVKRGQEERDTMRNLVRQEVHRLMEGHSSEVQFNVDDHAAGTPDLVVEPHEPHGGVVEEALAVHELLAVGVGGALLVGVLDAQQENAAGVARVQPVVKRRAHVAQMQVARGAGGESYSNGIQGGSSFIWRLMKPAVNEVRN